MKEVKKAIGIDILYPKIQQIRGISKTGKDIDYKQLLSQEQPCPRHRT